MVVSVPWQLKSSKRVAESVVGNAAGAVRRGEPSAEVAEVEVARDIRSEL